MAGKDEVWRVGSLPVTLHVAALKLAAFEGDLACVTGIRVRCILNRGHPSGLDMLCLTFATKQNSSPIKLKKHMVYNS